MATFAVTSENAIINMIIADTKEIAEEVTKLKCVEVTIENPIGYSWIFNGTTFVAPFKPIAEESDA